MIRQPLSAAAVPCFLRELQCALRVPKATLARLHKCLKLAALERVISTVQWRRNARCGACSWIDPVGGWQTDVTPPSRARDLEGLPPSMSSIEVRSSRDRRYHSRVSHCPIPLVLLALGSHHLHPERIGRQS